MVSLTKQTAFPVIGLFLTRAAAQMQAAARAPSAQAGEAEQKATSMSGSSLRDQSAPFQTSLALCAFERGKMAALGRKALAKPACNVGDRKRLSLKYQDTPTAVRGGR